VSPDVADVGPDVIDSPVLNRETPMPTYREMADLIAARIGRGEWPPGGVLPTTDDFAAEYRVSEATAYRALSLLVDRGTVIGVRGGRRYVPGVTDVTDP
jgi:DNA-binding GntR family transcriptional regulator